MNNYMKTVVAGIKNWVSTQFNKNKANWTVNDPTDPRYVHGRTHWVEETLIELMPEQTVTFASSNAVMIANSPVIFDIVEGQFYTVNFDGVRYEVSAKFLQGTLVIGNLSFVGIGDDSGEPFLYMRGNAYSIWATTSTETEHTIGVTGIVRNITKIPEEFLPDNSELVNHIDDINNPHKVTKEQLGLGNAENKSSATIRSELTSDNVSNALGYVPANDNNIFIVADITYSPDNYFTTDNAGTITGLTEEGKAASEIVIPKIIDGIKVTSIGYDAFYECTNLTNVTIPNSVTGIGKYAFKDCANLTSVTIPDSVTGIDAQAFLGCTNLINVTIPDSVTSIGNYAFSSCTSLTSVAIGNSVTSIGGSAFSGCTNLTSIVIPDSVTSIGYQAFLGCTKLNTVYYTGTEEEWNAINIKYDNGSLINATKVFNYVPEEQ